MISQAGRCISTRLRRLSIMQMPSNEFMLKPRQILLFLFLLFGLQLAPLTSVAAQDDTPAAEVQLDPATALKNYQKQLDSIKQQVSKADNDNQLSKLKLVTDDLAAGLDKLATELQPAQEKLQAQLDV